MTSPQYTIGTHTLSEISLLSKLIDSLFRVSDLLPMKSGSISLAIRHMLLCRHFPHEEPEPFSCVKQVPLRITLCYIDAYHHPSEYLQKPLSTTHSLLSLWVGNSITLYQIEVERPLLDLPQGKNVSGTSLGHSL
jgi:hypothetical protein